MRRALPRCLFRRATGARGVYTIWGTVVHENNEVQPQNKLSWTERWTNQVGLRGFQFLTTPVQRFAGVGLLSEPEEYLLSALTDDTERLLSVDWTFDFDSYWVDRVKSHEMMYHNLYSDHRSHLAKWIFGDASKNEAAKSLALQKLNYLKSALKWALQTEKVYSAIATARFHMQREVGDPFEREKILAGCVVACDKLAAEVPEEFKRKAVLDAEAHLNNMRHWVWDAPNAKQHFKRRLA